MMSIDDLYCSLKDSHTFNLEHLTTASVETLTLFMEQNSEIEQSLVLSLIEIAKQHGYDQLKSASELNLGHKLDTAEHQELFVPLLSLGRDHNLDALISHCVQWFKTNFTELKASGFVDALMANTSTEHGRNMIQLLLESMAVLP